MLTTRLKTHRSLLSSQSGLSLTKLLLVLAVLSVLFSGSKKVFLPTASEVDKHAALLKDLVQSLIINEKAWENTLKSNIEMACLQSGVECSRIISFGTEFILKDEKNRAVNGPGQGFKENGTPCTGYVDVGFTGNDECPFSMDLEFKTAPCSGDFCDDYDVIIEGYIGYNPKRPNLSYRSVSPNFSVQRGGKGESKMLKECLSKGEGYLYNMYSGECLQFGNGKPPEKN